MYVVLESFNIWSYAAINVSWLFNHNVLIGVCIKTIISFFSLYIFMYYCLTCFKGLVVEDNEWTTYRYLWSRLKRISHFTVLFYTKTTSINALICLLFNIIKNKQTCIFDVNMIHVITFLTMRLKLTISNNQVIINKCHFCRFICHSSVGWSVSIICSKFVVWQGFQCP